jgi:hypothetical protein
MEKFGLFDIIEKLAPLTSTAKTLLPALEKIKNSPPKTESKQQSEKKKTSLPSAINYIRRHEEMSRRIDARKDK